MPEKLRMAADIGGTFTDIIVMFEDGRILTRKEPSTPGNYAQGVVRGVLALLEENGIARDAVAEVMHGSTVATNAILERTGARTGLVTTRGFRDVLEFRRIRVPRLYEPLYVRPEPLAPRNLRFEVTERLGADGRVITPLAEEEVAACVEALKCAAVEAVAVSFLHSYANPAHERRVGRMLAAGLPGIFITLSSDLLPEIREYERTSTTVINAYVGPIVARYVKALGAALKAAGIRARLLVMQSSGGVLEAARVIEMPARIIECGPAAGVLGAARQAEIAGYRNVITLDMGGTTAKASLIENGNLTRTDEYEVGGGISLSSRLVKGGGYALKLPVIDISEVGAGGGSIVWFDRAGGLKVGPRSAGAEPGPACYGIGGSEPTVTDANVVLGYLNPDALAGGSMPIRADLSRRVIEEKVGRRLAAEALEAAWAVFTVANANMLRAVKAVSTYRGRDPADFVLMAFGGNGGIFAAELGRALEIRQIVVPPGAGVFSAIGLGMAELEFGRSRALLAPIERLGPGRLQEALNELEQEVRATLALPDNAIHIRRLAAMRYVGQAFELMIPLPEPAVQREDLDRLASDFAAEHERTYGHRLGPTEAVEMVAVEVIATAPRPHRAREPWLAARAGGSTPSGGESPCRSRPRRERAAYFGLEVGLCRTAVIAREELGDALAPGPLIIEEYEGTTVVPPWAGARLERDGGIVIEIMAGARP